MLLQPVLRVIGREHTFAGMLFGTIIGILFAVCLMAREVTAVRSGDACRTDACWLLTHLLSRSLLSVDN